LSWQATTPDDVEARTEAQRAQRRKVLALNRLGLAGQEVRIVR
jgi:hypothetical protein